MIAEDISKVDWEKARGIFAPEGENFIKKARDVWTKYPAAREALQILAALGTVSLMVMIPPLGITIGRLVKNQETSRYHKMWKRWEKQKMVRIRETPEGTVVEITQEGIKRALKYKLAELSIKKPIIWDGKWRLVIFDVSEKKKRNRDCFRDNLRRMGFYCLNESVFVHPYPCFDEIEYLRQMTGVGEEVTCLTAESIETGSDLKTHFDLA